MFHGLSGNSRQRQQYLNSNRINGLLSGSFGLSLSSRVCVLLMHPPSEGSSGKKTLSNLALNLLSTYYRIHQQR